MVIHPLLLLLVYLASCDAIPQAQGKKHVVIQKAFKIRIDESISFDTNLEEMLGNAANMSKAVEMTCNCSLPARVNLKKCGSTVLLSDTFSTHHNAIFSEEWVQYLRTSKINTCSTISLNTTAKYKNKATSCNATFRLRDPPPHQDRQEADNVFSVHQRPYRTVKYRVLWIESELGEKTGSEFVIDKQLNDTGVFSFGKCGFVAPAIKEDKLHQEETSSMVRRLAFLTCSYDPVSSFHIYLSSAVPISGKFRFTTDDGFSMYYGFIGIFSTLSVLLVAYELKHHWHRVQRFVRRCCQFSEPADGGMALDDLAME